MPRLGHARAVGLAGKLTNGFGNAKVSAGGAGLPDRQLPARGVERKTPVSFEGIGANEGRALAFAAESEDPRTAAH